MSLRFIVSGGLAVLALFAIGLLMLPGCDGTGGASMIRGGVFPQLAPLDAEEQGGGGGGAGGQDGQDEDEDEQQDTTPVDLPVEGTMTVSFTNDALIDVQIALWSSEEFFASTALVQQDANLRPLGPAEASQFLPILRSGRTIQATLDCADARTISAAVAEQLVLLAKDACISPPLRWRVDYECGPDQAGGVIIRIRDAPGGRLELLTQSTVYRGCPN